MHLEHSVHNRPLEEMEKNYMAFGSGGSGEDWGWGRGGVCPDRNAQRKFEIVPGRWVGVRAGSALPAEPHQQDGKEPLYPPHPPNTPLHPHHLLIVCWLSCLFLCFCFFQRLDFTLVVFSSLRWGPPVSSQRSRPLSPRQQ